MPRPYVKGRASTTPITRVRPGNTATSRPRIKPMTRAAKLSGEKTSTKPSARWCSTSMSAHAHDPHQPHRQRQERLLAKRQRDVDELAEDEEEPEAADQAREGDHDRITISPEPQE